MGRVVVRVAEAKIGDCKSVGGVFRCRHRGVGAGRSVVHRSDGQPERVAGGQSAVRRRDGDVEVVAEVRRRRAAERARDWIERQPARQGRPAGQRRAVGQGGVDVGEARRRHLKVQGRIFRAGPIHQCHSKHRFIIDGRHSDGAAVHVRQCTAGAGVAAIAGGDRERDCAVHVCGGCEDRHRTGCQIGVDGRERARQREGSGAVSSDRHASAGQRCEQTAVDGKLHRHRAGGGIDIGDGQAGQRKARVLCHSPA